MLGSLQFLRPFLRPSHQPSVALALHWHHTPAWACVDNRPVGLWHFLFVLQLSPSSSPIAHHCCLGWKNLFLVWGIQFLENSLGTISYWKGRLPCGSTGHSSVCTKDVWQFFHPFSLASSSLFLSPLTMTLLTTSACPFSCGYVGVEYLFVMPRSQQ